MLKKIVVQDVLERQEPKWMKLRCFLSIMTLGGSVGSYMMNWRSVENGDDNVSRYIEEYTRALSVNSTMDVVCS